MWPVVQDTHLRGLNVPWLETNREQIPASTLGVLPCSCGGVLLRFLVSR